MTLRSRSLSTSCLRNTEYKQKIPVFTSNPNLIFLKKAKSCLITMLNFQIFYKQMPIQLAPKVFLRTKRAE